MTKKRRFVKIRKLKKTYIKPFNLKKVNIGDFVVVQDFFTKEIFKIAYKTNDRFFAYRVSDNEYFDVDRRCIVKKCTKFSNPELFL